ncbi:5-keto-L-gluconate epimerase [Calderihabitans maritimus]|uniref:Xylose isomerase domain-containing protein n=1 Tax=Calderihabitans maritimus TaxID=1246530 RepID=A0A1Z5HX55_9FIRM|nr:5-keto-L-gluconate epimerase [Calderihabitans maritimus]GAW94112.1 xylose isomerase domain-containing protein [Calderihabitans maritimus]
MQKCIVVSGQTKFDALAFKEGLEEGIRKVATLGYDAVELAVRDPALVDLKGLVGLTRELGLPVVAIGTGQAYGDEGLSFTDPDESVRRKAVERIKRQVEFAANFGAQVIIGLIRGKRLPEVAEERARDWLLAALKECAGYAEQYGVCLTLEPINRYETNLINTIAEAMEIIDATGMSNIGILADTFHMNIEEPSMEESLRSCARYLTHLHVADSNRWVPGYGHIDFPSLIRLLRDIDYKGAVSAEILPKPDPKRCAEMTLDYMIKLGL